MANTYDRTKLDLDPNRIRLLISDVDVADEQFIFHDEEIDAFLAMEGSVLLAAARALEIIAANEVLVQKRIKLLDLQTDGPAEATALLAIAERFRKTEAEMDDGEADFDFASLRVDSFTSDQIRWNEIMELYGNGA